jgi:hypothetical protein
LKKPCSLVSVQHVHGLTRDELIANLRHTSTISPVAMSHTDMTCLVAPDFLLVGGGFEVIDQMEGGGNLATASFPFSTISWRARSKDEINVTESRIRVFTISINPNIRNVNGQVIGNVATTIERLDSDPNEIRSNPKSSIGPKEGFALCGGGGEAKYDINQMVWDLEPTSLAGPDVVIITDPNLQTFTAASTSHLNIVHPPSINTIAAYAMGIKFEPVEPGPEPEPKPPSPWPLPGPGTPCDRLIPLVEPQSSGSLNGGTNKTKAIDGDPNTRWVSTNISSPWISVGLQVQKPVCKVDIAWADGNVRGYKFYIESSLDRQNWTTLLTNGQSAGNTNSFESFIVSTTPAKYVKVTIIGTIPPGAGGKTTAQMTDIRVFSNQ